MLARSMRASGASVPHGNVVSHTKSGLLWIHLLELEPWKKTLNYAGFLGTPSQKSTMLPTIPLKNVVSDNLHLFLCVADVLFDQLILKLCRQDLIDKTKKLSNFECKHLNRYQNFVSSLGIPGYIFWIGRDSKQLKCRTLTGPEKLKLFTNIT